MHYRRGATAETRDPTPGQSNATLAGGPSGRLMLFESTLALRVQFILARPSYGLGAIQAGGRPLRVKYPIGGEGIGRETTG